jgi:hypothetical protein
MARFKKGLMKACRREFDAFLQIIAANPKGDLAGASKTWIVAAKF